jgi:hypothetical protein
MKRGTGVFSWLGIAAALVAASLVAASPAGAQLAFKLRNTGATGSEPNVGVTSGGVIFLGGWDHIARSTDDGENWTLHDTGPVGFAADRVLIVDRAADRVLVDDTDLVCTVLSWSDDLGETWTTNPVACGGGVTDHQKIAVGKRRPPMDVTSLVFDYPNVVYVCANGLTHTPCAASFDGGLTFGPGLPSMQIDAMNPGESTLTCAFQGVPVANAEGILYQPSTQCAPRLWWSADNALTWTHSVIPVTTSSDAPDIAITSNGTIYYFFTDANWKPMYAWSGDGGESWSAPVSVAPPGLRSAVFPVVAAGDDGRVAVAYYGTLDSPSGWSGNPGDAPESVRWNLFSAVATSADSTPVLSRSQLTSNADPVQIGCLSKLGGCLGNIADYIDIEAGPDGRAYIGYVDGCDGASGCDSASESTLDAGWVAIQTGGPLLGAAAP